MLGGFCFPKYNVHQQHYLTCFGTWLYAFFLRESQINQFFSISVKISMYVKLRAVSKMLSCQALGSTEQKVFPSYVFWTASNKTLWKRMDRSCPEWVLVNQEILTASVNLPEWDSAGLIVESHMSEDCFVFHYYISNAVLISMLINQ